MTAWQVALPYPGMPGRGLMACSRGGWVCEIQVYPRQYALGHGATEEQATEAAETIAARMRARGEYPEETR